MSRSIKDSTPIQAYMRGYSAGSRHIWPDTIPSPPSDIVKKYLEAVNRARETLDNWRAQLAPDDDWAVELGIIVAMIEDAELAVRQWIDGEMQANAR